MSESVEMTMEQKVAVVVDLLNKLEKKHAERLESKKVQKEAAKEETLPEKVN